MYAIIVYFVPTNNYMKKIALPSEQFKHLTVKS